MGVGRVKKEQVPLSFVDVTICITSASCSVQTVDSFGFLLSGQWEMSVALQRQTSLKCVFKHWVHGLCRVLPP